MSGVDSVTDKLERSTIGCESDVTDGDGMHSPSGDVAAAQAAAEEYGTEIESGTEYSMVLDLLQKFHYILQGRMDYPSRLCSVVEHRTQQVCHSGQQGSRRVEEDQGRMPSTLARWLFSKMRLPGAENQQQGVLPHATAFPPDGLRCRRC